MSDSLTLANLSHGSLDCLKVSITLSMIVAHAVSPLHHSWDVQYRASGVFIMFIMADLGAFCGYRPENWSGGSVFKGRLNVFFSVTHSQSRYVVHRGSLIQKIVKKKISDNHFSARKSYCIFASRYSQSIISRLYQAWSEIPDSYIVLLLSLWLDCYPSQDPVQYFINQQ